MQIVVNADTVIQQNHLLFFLILVSNQYTNISLNYINTTTTINVALKETEPKILTAN